MHYCFTNVKFVGKEYFYFYIVYRTWQGKWFKLFLQGHIENFRRRDSSLLNPGNLLILGSLLFVLGKGSWELSFKSHSFYGGFETCLSKYPKLFGWSSNQSINQSTSSVCRWGKKGREIIRVGSSHLNLSKSYILVIQKSWFVSDQWRETFLKGFWFFSKYESKAGRISFGGAFLSLLPIRDTWTIRSD